MRWSLKIISALETYGIRQQVLWPDKPIDHVKIDGDEFAIHIGLFADDVHVGVISLFVDGGEMQFRKLAILPAYQGHKGGQALIASCVAIAAQNGASKLWCDARQDALGFYTKMGFEIDAAVFFKSGVAYQKAFLNAPYPDITLPPVFEGLDEVLTMTVQYPAGEGSLLPMYSSGLKAAEGGAHVPAMTE